MSGMRGWVGIGALALSVLLPRAAGQWSVLVGDPRTREPAHLYQVFDRDAWEGYRGAPEESIRKFREARYGLFVHFGLSSFRGADLSWSRETRAFPDPGRGAIPDEEYEGFARRLALERFDADGWVRMAREAGMKYIVVVAKHHDGFHMWNTAHSDFKITNTPFGRDYLKELADACRRADMSFGVYYSQRDWHHPDYQPLDPDLTEAIPAPPYWKLLRQVPRRRAGPTHASYIRYLHDTVRELMTGYGRVDVLWWDALWWGGMYHADMWQSRSIEREVRRLQPNIVINNRASLPGDFDTPEQRLGMFQDERPWESCISLGPHWAWSPGEAKSKAEILRLLIGTASGDGNLLISTGARADGSFDPQHVGRLREVGSWLQRFGNTIYGTRGGPWKPGEWGGSTHVGDTAYLHVTSWPDGGLVLPDPGRAIRGAALVTAEEKVSVTRRDGLLHILVPESARDPIDTIIRMELGDPE